MGGWISPRFQKWFRPEVWLSLADALLPALALDGTGNHSEGAQRFPLPRSHEFAMVEKTTVGRNVLAKAPGRQCHNVQVQPRRTNLHGRQNKATTAGGDGGKSRPCQVPAYAASNSEAISKNLASTRRHLSHSTITEPVKTLDRKPGKPPDQNLV